MSEHSDSPRFGLDTPRQQSIQRCEWIAERLGWVVMTSVVLAALVGLLGPGPLSSRVVRSPDGHLQVEHNAIERYDAPCKLIIHFKGRETNQAMVSIGIEREFIDRTAVESIQPRPESAESAGDEILFQFRTIGIDQERIVYRYRNDATGSRRFHIRAVGSERVELCQFVWR
jgi:hypothetical protein